MLSSACIYEKTFKKYEENESSLRSDLGDNVPDDNDWKCACNLAKLLKNFNDMTVRVSGSQYVTLNNFFSKLADLFVHYMTGRIMMICLLGPWDLI